MTLRIRIPGLLDVVRLDDPAVFRDFAKDSRLIRDFDDEGRSSTALSRAGSVACCRSNNEPLSAVAPRNHPGRPERQAALEASLEQVLGTGAPAADKPDVLAAYVKGETGDHVWGQRFREPSAGSSSPITAAQPRPGVPRVFSMPPRAREFPAPDRVGDHRCRQARARRAVARGAANPAAVHATAIAVHTLVRSLQDMRALWHHPGARESVTADGAVTRSLRAPEAVLRRASSSCGHGRG